MKVLVVDDSIGTQNIAKKFLETHGYEVATADNGAAALDAYSKIRPDVVLLDITMPLMDGKETLNRILDIDNNATVIMTTAIDDGQIIEGFLSIGASGYLVKPFDFAEVVSTIKNVSVLRKNKTSITFFSLVRNKIEADIRKMFDLPTSIMLKEVSVINQERSPQTFSSKHQVRVVSQINQNSELTYLDDYAGFVTGFYGQRIGQIMTLIRNDDLNVLSNNLKLSPLIKVDNSLEYADVSEFFNIVNQKIVTILSSALSTSLSREPIRPYDKTKDKSTHWNDVVKASYEIKLNTSMGLDVVICFGRKYKEPSLTQI